VGMQQRAVEPPIANKYLTIPESAAYLRHGERTVWRLIADGALPYHRVSGGRRVLIRRTDLDALLEAGRVEPHATKVHPTHTRRGEAVNNGHR